MNGKRILIFLVVFTLIWTVSSGPVLAQGGRPDGQGPPDGHGPPNGGGRPLPTFLMASGTLTPYGEGLGFNVDGQWYVIDFGPEWYVPNDCLQGLLSGPGDVYTLQNGRYTIDLTCATGNGGCDQVVAPGATQTGAPNPNMMLNLARPRPGSGTYITAWGMVESKEGYILLRAWEVHYNGSWQWWRWDGQPWQKAQFLSCDPAGEGE